MLEFPKDYACFGGAFEFLSNIILFYNNFRLRLQLVGKIYPSYPPLFVHSRVTTQL